MNQYPFERWKFHFDCVISLIYRLDDFKAIYGYKSFKVLSFTALSFNIIVRSTKKPIMSMQSVAELSLL